MNLSLNSISFLFMATMTFGLVFLLLSLLISFLFWAILSRARLVELLKGKMPIRGVIALILFFQLLVILILSMNLNRGLYLTETISEQNNAADVWKKQKDYLTLNPSGDLISTSGNDGKAWWNFVNDQVKNHNGLFVNSYATQNPYFENSNYSIQNGGNFMFVTPNYLDQQGVQVSAEFKSQMKNLSYGHFGLIIPEKLKNRAKEFEKSIFGYKNDDGSSLTATTTFVADNQERFLYNASLLGSILTQKVEDPVIIVLTPESMGNGNNAAQFWLGNVNHIYTLGLEQTNQSLETFKVVSSINSVQSLKEQFRINSQNLVNEAMLELVSSIIAILVAIFFFVTSNAMYFTQYRREIFIKKVSGQKFFEIHKRFILVQAGVLVLTFPIMLYLTYDLYNNRNFLISSSTLIFFILLSALILGLQAKSETRKSISILKGE